MLEAMKDPKVLGEEEGGYRVGLMKLARRTAHFPERFASMNIKGCTS